LKLWFETKLNPNSC